MNIILATIRFLTLFCGLLLLVNPKFVDRDYYVEKAKLIFLVDDSESLQTTISKESLTNTINQFKDNGELTDRFNIDQYAFGAAIEATDSLTLAQRSTDIANALSTIDQIYLKGNNVVVLLTDGNSTYGRDYEYLNLNPSLTVFPVVVGDTTQYEDVSIGLVNSNTYAFLRNKFPIEATINYRGNTAIRSSVAVAVDGKTVHREQITLSPSVNSKTMSIVTEATSVGIKNIKISVVALENERNTANNTKETAIEVIDEKTDVVIVSDMLHPDIGALKKSIESNEQRSVTIIKPSEINTRADADLVLLYQPNRNFSNVYDMLKKSGLNYFTITGSKTDWNFLNRAQQRFFQTGSSQSEEIVPVLNNAFGIFGLGDFNLDNYPPLIGSLGDLELKVNNETILFQQIRGVGLNKPLFSILTEGKHKEAVLFGENIWRWRAQTFRNDQSFKRFDDFMGNLMVYLGSDNQRSRLELEYPAVFDNAGMAKIRASYFDESYQFDSKANLSITVNGPNDFRREYPMLLKGSYFEVDLSDLTSGSYQFTVSEGQSNTKRSGSFRILDFNPELQQTASDYRKLDRLAQKTGGRITYLDSLTELETALGSSKQFVPIQKSRENVVSLIDFRILLGLMAITLALEWFIRKYNGLI
ncbi:vWA domain-containing protein [Flagellimonas beolgyonensis]|uniref:vWA domain-containing protein n=1 Tax=Flagellimonas beolgyonensis TaxID=864064 RepID=UPI001F494575|nr:vWA domain-containing protein [Allomuricauda beolgyonensis]